MNKIKTKIRRVSYKIKHNYLSMNNIVLVAAVGCCLLWASGAISSMSRNWELAEKVMNREREKSLLELEVDTLELENTYFQTEEYQELAVRKQQNKKLPGETLIYLPPNSDEALHKYDHEVEDIDETIMQDERSNFEQWIAFLFGM